MLGGGRAGGKVGSEWGRASWSTFAERRVALSEYTFRALALRYSRCFVGGRFVSFEPSDINLLGLFSSLTDLSFSLAFRRCRRRLLQPRQASPRTFPYSGSTAWFSLCRLGSFPAGRRPHHLLEQARLRYSDERRGCGERRRVWRHRPGLVRERVVRRGEVDGYGEAVERGRDVAGSSAAVFEPDGAARCAPKTPQARRTQRRRRALSFPFAPYHAYSNLPRPAGCRRRTW